jgi:hypothetical protein
VWKEFTCADGTGTIIFKLEGLWQAEGGGEGTWMILSGTGNYSNLHGNGEVIDIFDWNTITGVDYFTGEMH